MSGPRRLGPTSPRTALHGRDATRRIETQAARDLPAGTLMARAGRSVARLACAVAPHAERVWIVAGPGNNGGDGFEAATHLVDQDLEVVVTWAGDAAALPDDARAAHARALAAGVTVVDHPPALPGPRDLVIDALLGVGATRAPDTRMAAWIACINAAPCAVLAVDLPTGLDADTGHRFGTTAVTATHTLTLLTVKPGLFTGHGRDACGTVWFDDLGVGTDAHPAEAWRPAAPPALASLHAHHKGSYGDVLVVGGARGMAGAAVLAARAAHAGGAGRVPVDLLDDTAPALRGLRPELVFRATRPRATLPRDAVVVAGCGGGDPIVPLLPALLHDARRLVLDADALNAVAADDSLARRLAARAARGQDTVLTPHPLEAARLLGRTVADVQAHRLAAAVALAEACRCTVVLKGSGSVVATPGEPPAINPTGHASLATAGTGDVLAGWLGGRWAAADAPGCVAAVRAVWEHGAAADRTAVHPMRAADLVDALLHAPAG